jgi:type IV pilus assembly protein PilB
MHTNDLDSGQPDWLLQVAQKSFENLDRLSMLEQPMDLGEAWRQIIRLTGVDSWSLARAVADAFHLDVAKLDDIDFHSAKKIPETLARRHHALPLREEGGELLVAVADPTKLETLKDFRFVSQKRIRLEIAPPEEIDFALATFYSKLTRLEQDIFGEINLTDQQDISQSLADHDVRVISLAQRLIKVAIDRGASDIHIQSFAGAGLVRYRIDGLLQREMTLPLHILLHLIRYVKVQSGMDTTKTMIPQDGRLTIHYNNGNYELRISTLPNRDAERLVIRVLNQSKLFSLSHSNFSENDRKVIARIANNRAGIFLITGPTGSGKTTTLYSILSSVSTDDINIITVEEPVEYRLVGISQVDVDANVGMTFAAALRAILRQDPDVILVGEIRDKETAEIALQAAMTGHLVLSTLHTNDAPTAIPRLTNLGISSIDQADALLGVLAQRLLRRLCPACKTQSTDLLNPMEQAFVDVSGERVPYRAKGCKACNYVGYKGRVPILEILEIEPGVRKSLLEGNTHFDSIRQGAKGYYRPMALSALDRILNGETTVQEAFRVLGYRFWNQLVEHFDRTFDYALLESGDMVADAQAEILVYSANIKEAQRIADILEETHLYRVHVCSEHKEAIKTLEVNRNISCLVLDTVGGHAAIRLLQGLRDGVVWAGLPVLLHTESGDEAMLKMGEKLGVHDVVEKSDKKAVLKARLSVVLNR